MYQAAYDLALATKQSSAMVSACTGIARLYAMDKDNQTNAEAPTDLTGIEQEAIDAGNKITSLRIA
jgi:hypothetical protein